MYPSATFQFEQLHPSRGHSVLQEPLPRVRGGQEHPGHHDVIAYTNAAGYLDESS